MIKTSETISKISGALIKAQKEIKVAAFDATNPHFRNKYATLGSVVEACKSALNKNDICFIQGAHSDTEFANCVCVTTRLIHSSGEFIEDTIAVPCPQMTPQAYGSSLTYAKRYGLSSLVGVISDEDDDAEAAMPQQNYRAPQPTVTKTVKKAEAPVSEGVAKLRAEIKTLCSDKANAEAVTKARESMQMKSMGELADFDEAKLTMFLDLLNQNIKH